MADRFKVRTEPGSIGMNLIVENLSDTTFEQCFVQLNGGKYGLRERTVLDANGHRAYPLFLFIDRTGSSVGVVRDVLIDCYEPRAIATFGQ